MSRGLRPAFFLLFLVAAVAASAGPDDLFDVRAPGALQPGQKEIILALENGRYILQDGHFRDERAADPSLALLTNARVSELLAGPPAGGRPDAAVPTAGDAAYQRALSRVPKGSPAHLNFDGGAARAGDIRGPPAGAGAAAPADPAVLQAQFLSRLVFKGSKEERAALGEAVSLIIKSKTGRGLAAKFVKERGSAEVKLETINNAGETDTDEDPPVVTLSREYLGKDPDHSRVLMAGTLAHELFGHAFEAQRAKKAGFPALGLYHYRGDEVGSRLIDWMVQTELTGKVSDDEPSLYLENPEAFHRRLLTADPYYITTLSPAEMKDPVAALRGRRKRLADDAAKTEIDIKDMGDWRPIIAHFVGVLHRVAKARFAPAEKELDDYFKWASGHRKKLAACKETLEGKIKLWSSPAGAKEKKVLRTASDSAYMKDLEAVLAARAGELRRLRADVRRGRAPASEIVIEMPPLVIGGKSPAEPSIDLDELGRMSATDRKNNPGHLK